MAAFGFGRGDTFRIVELKGLNRPGWRGRENLRMFMRHWTAGWLKRERYTLFKQLPWSFGMGRRLEA